MFETRISAASELVSKYCEYKVNALPKGVHSRPRSDLREPRGERQVRAEIFAYLPYGEMWSLAVGLFHTLMKL
jgi:hypothetical protein